MVHSGAHHRASGRSNLDQIGLTVGILTKLIVVLALIMFITGQFTRDKQVRAKRRQNLTNMLLILLICMVGFLIITSLKQ